MIKYWIGIVTIALSCVGYAEAKADVTFAKDIAPIVYRSCASCHRPDQSGPFSLLTYDEVKQHSETILAVTSNRYMPPWKPIHGDIEFANNRQLKDEEIALFQAWVDADCPSGDLSTAPVVPQFPSKWQLGEPDLVVTMAESFEIPADGPDVYRSFVLPLNLPEDKWIKAIELRPSAAGVVHHALFFITEHQASSRPAGDGQPGMRGMGFIRPGNIQGQNLDRLASGLGGYVPGAVPNRLPGDLARYLPKGCDIIMQTHFHPTGKVEHEQSEMGLYFADKEPEHKLVPIQVPPMFGIGAGIDIPAGESNYLLEESFTLPADVLAHEIGGHAHYICRSMNLVAKLPDGKELTILNIDDWDLDWQDQYQLATALSLPKGTVITSKIVYDNSANNPLMKWDRSI
jgi:mono/diheme cytochrome c family protein